MEDRWSSAQRAAGSKPDPKERKRNRAGLFLVLTLTAAGMSGFLAMLGFGPFGSLQVLAHQIISSGQSAQIQAGSIFPSVPPVHKVVTIYDPPRSAPPAGSGPPEDQPSPSPKPSPKPEPSDSPEPGDNGN
jgi:hypothetical protein